MASKQRTPLNKCAPITPPPVVLGPPHSRSWWQGTVTFAPLLGSRGARAERARALIGVCCAVPSHRSMMDGIAQDDLVCEPSLRIRASYRTPPNPECTAAATRPLPACLLRAGQG